MLDGNFSIETDDGQMVYVRPEITMTRGRHIALMKNERALRTVYLNRDLTIRRVDADDLINSGYASRIGDRFEDQPALSAHIAMSQRAPEVDLITGSMRDEGIEGRGIEFGCGYGGLLRGLWANGLSIDGVDQSEVAIRYLRGIEGRGAQAIPPETRLFIGELSKFAAPSEYAFAVSGIDAIYSVRSSARLTRHLHFAALSVAEFGCYAIRVSVAPAAQSLDSTESGGSQNFSDLGDNGLTLKSEIVFEDQIGGINLARIGILRDDGTELANEFRIGFARSFDEWIDIFNRSREWECTETIQADGSRVPIGKASGQDLTGDTWFLLRRTGNTGAAMFAGS